MTTFSAQLDCYQKTVLKASEGWVAQCDDLKTHIGHYNESHQNYDHYTRKVVSLREQRDKRAAQGKSEKAKEVDKLIRVGTSYFFSLLTFQQNEQKTHKKQSI